MYVTTALSKPTLGAMIGNCCTKIIHRNNCNRLESKLKLFKKTKNLCLMTLVNTDSNYFERRLLRFLNGVESSPRKIALDPFDIFPIFSSISGMLGDPFI